MKGLAMEIKEYLRLKAWNGIKEIQIPYVIDEKGCFVCQKGIRGRGYSYITEKSGREIGLHRYIYELLYGRLLCSKIVIRHSCDNPACINPDHLSHGVDADNVADKVARGRIPHGENHYSSKLNDELVTKLRKKYSNKKVNMSKIARIYGVNDKTIGSMLKGETWKHVK